MIDNPSIFYAKQELAILDQKSIRAIRCGEAARLAELEAQAEVIRLAIAAMPLQIEVDDILGRL